LEYTRAINPNLDLLQDERDELSEDDISKMQTVFYDGLSMRTQKAKIYNAVKKSQKRRRVIEETQQVYHVGDTILIETDSFYRIRKPPSIAVIVAMWECRNKDDSTDGQMNSTRMRIRVHWFLRPTEMASIRAKRAHDKVRRNYLSFTILLTVIRMKYTIV
jgi:origin recognition complex subunit 1